jgi:hypothetical protein
MTNIYNKKVLVENGTLINNWFEEEILKKVTGQTRTIPGVHIKKKHYGMDSLEHCGSQVERDVTKTRILGLNKAPEFSTTNLSYGDFTSEEHKFNKIGVKEKIFKDFFTSYLTNEKKDKLKHENQVSSSRLNESNYKSSMIKQPIITKIGSRHMLTPDNIPIDQSRLDKYFMANHDMGKYQRVIPEDKMKDYVDTSIPFVDDKAITYWSQNSDKSNMYHSHKKGINEFGKSSGMTQLVGSTKSAHSYYGNIQNSKGARNVHIHEDSPDYCNFISQMKFRVEDLTDCIRAKFLDVMFKKGWLAIRKYKQYLLNILKRKTTLIEKSDFKYFSTNFGIYFSDNEVDFIYNLFDYNKSNKICYEKFVENLIKVRKKICIF